MPRWRIISIAEITLNQKMPRRGIISITKAHPSKKMLQRKVIGNKQFKPLRGFGVSGEALSYWCITPLEFLMVSSWGRLSLKLYAQMTHNFNCRNTLNQKLSRRGTLIQKNAPAEQNFYYNNIPNQKMPHRGIISITKKYPSKKCSSGA